MDLPVFSGILERSFVLFIVNVAAGPRLRVYSDRMTIHFLGVLGNLPISTSRLLCCLRASGGENWYRSRLGATEWAIIGRLVSTVEP